MTGVYRDFIRETATWQEYTDFIRETATWQEYTETLLGRQQHGRSIQRLY